MRQSAVDFHILGNSYKNAYMHKKNLRSTVMDIINEPACLRAQVYFAPTHSEEDH